MARSRTLEEINRAHMIQPSRDYNEQENQDPRIVIGGKGIQVRGRLAGIGGLRGADVRRRAEGRSEA